jgi:carbon monoxide dehydrogenase subunit G
MAIRIETSFLVPAPVVEAWPLLIDVPRIAPCMPGAELTETLDALTYKGRAHVKVGPVQLLFSGEARLHDIDAVARTSRLSIRGSDTKGRGNVQSEMSFSAAPEGEQTRVSVAIELTLTGSVAQYGRGAGLIREICNQFTKQFAANLAAQIASGGTQAGPAEVKPLSALGLVSGALRSMVTRNPEADGAAPADRTDS